MILAVINILFTAYPEVLRCFVTITAIVAWNHQHTSTLSYIFQRLSMCIHLAVSIGL